LSARSGSSAMPDNALAHRMIGDDDFRVGQRDN
jgi:hypothetical protein